MVEDWKAIGGDRLRRTMAIARDGLGRYWLRLQSRAELVFMAGGLCLAMVIFTGTGWSAALLGFSAVLAFVVARQPLTSDGGFLNQGRTLDQGQSSRLTAALVDAMPDPAWALNRQGVVLHANAPAASLFGSLRPGLHISVATRDPELISAVASAIETSTPQVAELQQRVPVERRLLAIVALVSQASPRDNLPALLLTLRDLTAQDRLAQMRADFVANASHELRTPLASLRGFVETLQGSARHDAAARERFLAIMSTQADRMTRLIDDLLSLSRVEMREHLAPTATVDLVPVLTQVVQALEPMANATEVNVAIDAPSSVCLVRGDRDELAQVFQNLIQNAIKYGRRNGRVDVVVTHKPGAIGRPARFLVDVRDDGPGIAPEHLPRLTERFYRVNASQSRDKGGTGLGLAIVKHIVSRHAAELRITSTVSQGSSFAILIDEVSVSDSIRSSG